MKNVIYTKKGDDGRTALADKKRVDKFNPLVEAIGTIDELNASIGILPSFNPYLDVIQNSLLNIGGYLAHAYTWDNPKKDLIKKLPKVTKSMETEIDIITQELPELHDFILPKGYYHVARTVCRRAERRVAEAKLQEQLNIDPSVLQFINRLSDYLFMLARQANRAEVKWRHGK